jgi:hypothetical protein
MPGDPLVRFDEGEWAALRCRPLSYSTVRRRGFHLYPCPKLCCGWNLLYAGIVFTDVVDLPSA